MSVPEQRSNEPSEDHNLSMVNTVTRFNEDQNNPIDVNSSSTSMNMSLVSVESAINSEGTEVHAPRTLQDLLGISTSLHSSTRQETSSSGSTSAIDSDKQRETFLREALAQLSVDAVAEMKERVEILATITDDLPAKDLGKYETTLDAIIDEVCSIDMANVFYQVGGLKTLLPLLRHQQGLLQWKAANIIAECCQNNPFCKTLSVTDDVFSPLMEMASNQSDFNVQFKAISAISAIVRDNPEGIKQFRKYDGLTMVYHSINSKNEKIIVKTAFLIMALCNTDATIKDEFLQTSIVENLISLARLTEILLAEHLLNALLALIRNHKPAIKECLREELGFYEHIKQTITINSFDESFEEYIGCAKEIRLILKDYKMKELKKKYPDNKDIDDSYDEDTANTTPEDSL